MLKNLKKNLKSEQKDKNIFDIVIYGSFIKDKDNFNDIDIMVIFKEGILKERLDKIQSIKNKLKKLTNKKIDIKQMLLFDFFSKELLARSGLLLEGISVFNDKEFSQRLGFKAYTLFYYNLKNLSHTEKVKFNYILAGRNSKGIIEELKAKRLANGVFKVPIENSIIFNKILKNNNVNFSKNNILEES
jgi:predicted nucleotidyltransferase